ncbi:ComF family protein [Chitinimonas sp.]|uniref:ComF family protein n=1 Tax=Chitinimonas sp. TaxID=1934313 RepID=UPI0035B2DB53
MVSTSLLNRLGKLSGQLAGILLPQACVLCGSHGSTTPICSACAAELPWLGLLHCPVCALGTPQGGICGECLNRTRHFDHTVAAWDYHWPIDRLIPAWKYRGQLSLTKPLSDGLLSRIKLTADRPELLLAMPLHVKRQRERGFNQAGELAKQLGRQLGIEVDLTRLARPHESAPLASLPWSERRKAIKGAFALHGDVHGKHIALIDDVMTTGASLDELARLLKQAGARRVDCWVLARTQKA